MKRLLTLFLVLCSMLPYDAPAEKTVLRLLGMEETADDRRTHPDVAYQQVQHEVWGDPLVWIAEDGADVVYINGWGKELRMILAQSELLDLRASREIANEVSRMTRWVRELVTEEDGAILALPTNAKPLCFTYRQDGWDAAGLTEADVPQSYEDLLGFLEMWCDRLEREAHPTARVADLFYWNTGTASCNYGHWLMELLLTCHAMQQQYAGEAVSFSTPEFIQYAKRTRFVAQRLYQLEPRGQQAEQLPVLFHNGLNGGRAGNSGLSYELSHAMPMRMTSGQPALICTRAEMIVIPAAAVHPEEALCFVADRAKRIPWHQAIGLYADFKPGMYAYEDGAQNVWIDAGWLAEYHSYEGIYYCCGNVFGQNRNGETGKEKYVLQFLKKEITAQLLAQRLDGLLD
ncbi:MAG: hypothetical protein IJZ74_01455 [Clostridia bacterium]|nr:hypothetical protein [Clostridia bacterium]